MTVIIIIKTLAIGCLGAGGFCFIMSFLLPYFPMPALHQGKSILSAWTSSKHKEKGDLGEKVWTISQYFFIAIFVLIWWGAFAAYAYLLYNALLYYIPLTGNDFWLCYGIAIALPSLWALVQFFRFFKPKEEEQVGVEDDAGKTILERMANMN